MMPLRRLALACLLLLTLPATAQVGEHRSEFAMGASAGYVLSNVGFISRIPQSLHGGLTGGITMRYTSEKYFSSICAVVGEVNYVQAGWKESILDREDQPVINQLTGVAEAYQRNINYLQVPVFARLGWGRERSGFQFFFQAGPQFGIFLSESSSFNFDLDQPNLSSRVSVVSSNYVDSDGNQIGSDIYHKPTEHKFDYGITAGIGLEYSHPRLGHFLLDGRYYYGLADLYGNSKRDYFSRSNVGNIVIKLTYLRDIRKTINPKIK